MCLQRGWRRPPCAALCDPPSRPWLCRRDRGCRVRLILPHALHYIIALMRSQIEANKFGCALTRRLPQQKTTGQGISDNDAEQTRNSATSMRNAQKLLLAYARVHEIKRSKEVISPKPHSQSDSGIINNGGSPSADVSRTLATSGGGAAGNANGSIGAASAGGESSSSG